MTTVSVVIPTYNRSNKLKRAINSALNQTYTNLEIIIIDDGSTDNTLKVVQEYSDNRIKYIYCCDNYGANHARNIGIKNANGKYISFLDSDDALKERYHEITVNRLEESDNECIGAYVSADTYNNGDFIGSKRIKKETVEQKDLLDKNIIGGFSCTIFKKDVFETVGMLDEDLAASQDYDFYLRALENGKIVGVDKILLDYYLQSDSISKDIQSKSSANSQILQKHSDIISYKRRSSQLFREGTLHGVNGNMRAAKKKIWSAIKIEPTNIIYHSFLILSFTNKGIFSFFYNLAKKIERKVRTIY